MILTRAQVREVDQRAINDLAMPGLILMENAGLNAASATVDYLDHLFDLPPSEARVVIVCGGGNNGGDGYVIARHLHNWGVQVAIYASKSPENLHGDAAVNAKIAQRMGLPIHVMDEVKDVSEAVTHWQRAHLLVDALLGTGFQGELREDARQIIQGMNQAAEQGVHIVAVDVPSGMDCDSEQQMETATQADVTVTFVAEKPAMQTDAGLALCGRIVVADIGVPDKFIERVLRGE